MGSFYNWLQERRASAIAQDAEFKAEDHPRNTKGGTGGGQFAKKPETLAKEDSRDERSKTEDLGTRKNTEAASKACSEAYYWNLSPDERVNRIKTAKKEIFGEGGRRFIVDPPEKMEALKKEEMRRYGHVSSAVPRQDKFDQLCEDFREAADKAIDDPSKENLSKAMAAAGKVMDSYWAFSVGRFKPDVA